MKKTLFCGILVAIFGLGLTSCTVDNSRYTQCSCDVYNTTLRVDAWTLDYDYTYDDYGHVIDKAPYYCATFDLPQLTSYIYSKGSVQVWREFNYSYTNSYQRPLPYCEPRRYIYDDSDPDDIIYGLYTQTVAYEYGFDSYGNSYICIYVYNSDFSYDYDFSKGILLDPGTMYFHLRIEN